MATSTVSWKYTTSHGTFTSPQVNINVPTQHAPALEQLFINQGRSLGGTMRILRTDRASVGAFKVDQKSWDKIFGKKKKKD